MSRTSILWFLSEHWAESKIDSRFVWLRSSSTTQGPLNVKPKRRWPWFATPSFNKAIRKFDALSGMSMRRNLPPRQWMRRCFCTRSSWRSGSPKIRGSWAVGGVPASKSVRQPWQSCWCSLGLLLFFPCHAWGIGKNHATVVNPLQCRLSCRWHWDGDSWSLPHRTQ